jgi:hypothetical protein
MKKRQAGYWMVLWSLGLLVAMQLTASAQTLTHRYSFFSQADGSTNAVDVVGTANGTCFDDAVVTGGQLLLDGNAYVQLPPGIITNDLAVTVEVWGDYPPSGQGTWANLFDFGSLSVNDTGRADAHSISFCIDTSGVGEFDAAISDTDDANVVRQNCYLEPSGVPYPVAGQTGAYIAAVFDPPAGYIAIYTNGVLAAKLTGVTSTITPGVWDASNLIGWDNWPDPNMTGSLDEFRIWNGALSGPAIGASYESGFKTLNTNAGTVTGIQVSAPSPIVEGGQTPSTVLASYSLLTNMVDVTTLCTFSSGNTNILSVDTNGNIHGVGVGTASVTALLDGETNSVSVTVVEPVSILAHRYSFSDSGTIVKDSVGTLDGNLMGTAVESSGQVVLDGTAGCYVDLSSNSFSADGIITGFQTATVDYWATIGAIGNWNYAWAFGNSTGAGINYIDNVVRNGNTGHRIDDNGIAAQQTIVDMLGNFANETVHCTTVIDPASGHLAVYTNGVLSGFATNDFQPLSAIATNFVYVGRSLWTAPGPAGTGDPYLLGSIDELRVYNGTLTPAQIALADVSGANNTNLVVGAIKSIAVSLPTMQLGDIVPGGMLVTYANLTNFDLNANSITPVSVFTSSNSNVVYQATDGRVHAVGLGTATMTANYQGLTASQSVTVEYMPTLEHRYSFMDAPGSTNAADSVGGTNWNGVVMGGGTFTGTNLELLGSVPQYVQLPSGILSNYPAVTIDTWVQFPDPAPLNCMLWGFGNTDAGGNGDNYIFCAPQGGRIAMSGLDPGYAIEEGCTGAGDITTNGSVVHLTAVFDPPAGVESWYTNGVLVSQNTGLNIPMSFVESETNYICHSLYTGDPHEDLNVLEFRIYNGALSAADVAKSQTLGPSQLLTASSGGTGPTLSASISGGNIVITWPVSGSTGYQLYQSSTIGPNAIWAPATGVISSVVGANNQASIPVGSGGSQFYVLKN